MIKFIAHLDGKDELIAKFKTYTAEKQKAVEGVYKKTGFDVERAAKEMVPVLTGRLRNSITTVWTGGGGGKGKDGIKPPEGRGFAVLVGTAVRYARRIEHGFIGQDKLGRDYRQEGRPYLFPAFFMFEGELVKRLKAVFQKKA